eukprot:762559-Hanusia_phi.AAC.3
MGTIEAGAYILRELLLQSELYPILQQSFYHGNVECADVMLEMDWGKIRKKEVSDLREHIRQNQKGFKALHLGAKFSDMMHRAQLLRDFNPVYRVFNIDVDCCSSGPELFVSQAFMAGLHCLSVLRQFMTDGSEEQALVCFTGGWHLYFASDHLARLPTEVRCAMLRNLQRPSFFARNKTNDAFLYDKATGLMQLPPGVAWHRGCLLRTYRKEGITVMEWDCGRDLDFLLRHKKPFLSAAQNRMQQYHAAVVSALNIARHEARSLEVRERVDGLARDVGERRLTNMMAVMHAVNRIERFAELKQEDPCSFGCKGWLTAVIMYACISYDCTRSGMFIDLHSGNMTQMLRAPLSAKVKKQKDNSVTSYIALPLGTPSEAVQCTWAGGTLQLTDLCDSLDMQEQPRLQTGLFRFYRWCRRLRFAQNRAAVQSDDSTL